jgi:pimeloyl-ACP methyl ester carboxylesterase
VVLRPTAVRPAARTAGRANAEVSPDGAAHSPVVVAKIARAANEKGGLGPTELSMVTFPTLVMAADDDLVTLEHTLALYRGLPDAQLAIVIGTSHLLLHEKPELCTRLVIDFLSAEPRQPDANPPDRRTIRIRLNNATDAAGPG